MKYLIKKKKKKKKIVVFHNIEFKYQKYLFLINNVDLFYR